VVTIITATLILTGGITFYPADKYEGSPLACPGYRYERATGPWLAVDVDLLASDLVSCGDWFAVHFYDGSVQFARALDTGYLADYAIWDTGLPFVADLPSYWRAGRETATGSIEKIPPPWLRRAGAR
jgi:hypothetical protein